MRDIAAVRRRAFLLVIAVAMSGWADDAPIDFPHDIAPLLKKHCVECHGGEETKGGFSLNTRDLLMESDAVVPGKPGESRLIELVTSTNTDEQMPPKDRPRLSAAEIDKLKKWIEQDAVWEAGFTFAENRYEPPLRPRKVELPPAVDGRDHPIDRILDAYFREHEITRPEIVDDSTFIRRASLDIVGLLPEPAQRAEFLADPSSEKRGLFVHQLLDNDVAYAEHWLSFWNDLLRNDYSGTGFITGGRKQITPWLYEALVENRPYNEMVRRLIAPDEASEGFSLGIRWRGNVNASQTQEIQFAQNVSQAFLGINMKCASCHDSFIDRWTLEETYGLAQIYAKEPLILHRCDKSTGKQAKAAWMFPELGQVDASASQQERLNQLAALMTHPENGRFTRTIVNRIWHRLMGRGIVHPVDAMHTEPWNADLLDYLGLHLQENNYDLKKTIEFICTSKAYQGRTPASSSQPASSELFRGPTARRMTAEQFMDTVWQITGAAPSRYDAGVLRLKKSELQGIDPSAAKLNGQWIWSYAEGSAAKPAAGETVSFRRKVVLDKLPQRAVAAVTGDNEYQLFVNHRLVESDDNWESIEVLNLLPHLKAGDNDLLIVAKNTGDAPNPAALFFEARLVHDETTPTAIGTDSSWKWSSSIPDASGRFPKPPKDWKPAVAVANPEVWSRRVGDQLGQLLAVATQSMPEMVRASLLKNDAFMAALGRPTRDQIVSMRPSELTTLEAIDLANGQTFADSIASGAKRLLEEGAIPTASGKSTAADMIHWVYTFALSRAPTPEELAVASELLGENLTPASVEDFLWAVFMLPEFQLVR